MCTDEKSSAHRARHKLFDLDHNRGPLGRNGLQKHILVTGGKHVPLREGVIAEGKMPDRRTVLLERAWPLEATEAFEPDGFGEAFSYEEVYVDLEATPSVATEEEKLVGEVADLFAQGDEFPEEFLGRMPFGYHSTSPLAA